MIAQHPIKPAQLIDYRYIEAQKRSLKELQKNDALFFQKYENKSQQSLAFSHPLRVKFVGILPLSFELGCEHNTSLTHQLNTKLAEDDLSLNELQNSILNNSNQAKVNSSKINNMEGGVNAGNTTNVLHRHRYFAKGQHYFKITEQLSQLLSLTDIKDKASCQFFNTPFESVYVECRDPNVKIWNQETAWHQIEGFYINRYMITEEEIRNNWDSNLADSRYMLGYLAKKGYISRNGGDVIMFEVLATGSPKETIFNDATYAFSFVIQDPVKSINEAIEAHTSYYQYSHSKIKMLPNGEIETPMSHDDKLTFTNTIELMAKTLLYINSSQAHKREVNEELSLEQAIKRTFNKAKIRKLERKIASTSNYILIGCDRYQSLKHQKNQKTIKTHWRRGFFRNQRYGEKNALMRLKWIEPTVVNSGENIALSKEYLVK
ncbi:hypothetical protein [Thalassotalea piscium]|uniref:Uncharacterized protein n=1 Tax=Thalassotalea piscium TaxID=1230533 RepID=A0A7X0TTD2_9GAMM|nr:hypothetical protein [Thalassotalea piscium]MBB6543137.1 hypothetical protein [Thalassotalea piscium]